MLRVIQEITMIWFGMEIKIVNIVATAAIGNIIRLDELANLSFITYNPSRYSCAYFKDETMESKVSIFPSGKMIVVGAKSYETTKRDIEHVFEVLDTLGYLKEKVEPMMSVKNIVITADLESKINLEEIQSNIPGVVYEPEQFPAAIFRPENSDVTALLFSSGKMVITGIKSELSINTEIQIVMNELNLEQN